MTRSATAYAGQATVSSRPAITLFTALLWVQGLYYFVTGVWPLVSIETFQMVTGPKTDHLVTGREADHWLVMTVGVLVAAVGLTLLVAARRGREPVEVAVLAVASAVGLTAIDVVYVARRVIAPIYLADAAAEVVLLAAWAVALLKGRRGGVERHLEMAGEGPDAGDGAEGRPLRPPRRAGVRDQDDGPLADARLRRIHHRDTEGTKKTRRDLLAVGLP